MGLLLLAVVLMVIGGALVGHYSRCEHLHTRCLHGDEIPHPAWTIFGPICRQRCVVCFKNLNRSPICWWFKDCHTWSGFWDPENDPNVESIKEIGW